MTEEEAQAFKDEVARRSKLADAAAANIVGNGLLDIRDKKA